MPANVYECMFLLDTTKVAGDVPAAAKQLQGVLERHHAEILASRPWDERRLAFPIKNRGITHKKGLYYLTYFRMEGKNLAPLERDVALTELILRSLVIKIDPKLVDTMLALARDEQKLALETASEEPAEEVVIGEDGAPVEGPRGGGGRRPRRPADDEDKD